MAFEVSTPDIDNYIHRINQIQRVIIPTSATVYSPSAGAINYPYWLTLARNASLGLENQSASIITLTVDMLLVRGGAKSGYDGAREKEVLSDMALVVSYFKRHKDLTTTTYPAIQNYFVPDSALLTQVSRFEGQVQGGGDILGSLYTLQWKHRLIKTTTDISTPPP